MDEKFNAILSIAIIPQVIDLITDKEKMDEISAIDVFYSSKTYDLLANEKTKMWHYSPLTLYMIWKSEQETGNIIFPEE